MVVLQEVSLYLSPLRRQKSSAPLAVFTIPALSTTWNRLAVQVCLGGRRRTHSLFLTTKSHYLHHLGRLSGWRRKRPTFPELPSSRFHQHWQTPGWRCCQNFLSSQFPISESGVWPRLIPLHWTGDLSNTCQTNILNQQCIKMPNSRWLLAI